MSLCPFSRKEAELEELFDPAQGEDDLDEVLNFPCPGTPIVPPSPEDSGDECPAKRARPEDGSVRQKQAKASAQALMSQATTALKEFRALGEKVNDHEARLQRALLQNLEADDEDADAEVLRKDLHHLKKKEEAKKRLCERLQKRARWQSWQAGGAAVSCELKKPETAASSTNRAPRKTRQGLQLACARREVFGCRGVVSELGGMVIHSPCKGGENCPVYVEVATVHGDEATAEFVKDMLRHGGFHPASEHAWANRFLKDPDLLPAEAPQQSSRKRVFKATCALGDECPRRGLVQCRGGRACERLWSDEQIQAHEDSIQVCAEPWRRMLEARRAQEEEQNAELRMRMALDSL